MSRFLWGKDMYSLICVKFSDLFLRWSIYTGGIWPRRPAYAVYLILMFDLPAMTILMVRVSCPAVSRYM